MKLGILIEKKIIKVGNWEGLWTWRVNLGGLRRCEIVREYDETILHTCIKFSNN